MILKNKPVLSLILKNKPVLSLILKNKLLSYIFKNEPPFHYSSFTLFIQAQLIMTQFQNLQYKISSILKIKHIPIGAITRKQASNIFLSLAFNCYEKFFIAIFCNSTFIHILDGNYKRLLSRLKSILYVEASLTMSNSPFNLRNAQIPQQILIEVETKKSGKEIAKKKKFFNSEMTISRLRDEKKKIYSHNIGRKFIYFFLDQP